MVPSESYCAGFFTESYCAGVSLTFFISITKSISKIFIPNIVCVLTNERYKTYQTGFSLCSLGHAPGVGLWGAGGAQVVKKSNFQTWSCGISNRRG